MGFDAILAFDLAGAGGIAWRLGQDLGIPAGGWAFGGDLRVSSSSRLGDIVRQVLIKLDIVFYQSHELRRNAAVLLGKSSDDLNAGRPPHSHSASRFFATNAGIGPPARPEQG